MSITMSTAARRTALVFALLLPVAGLALPTPASAASSVTTSNEVVYTVTNVAGRSSVVLRDLATKAQSTPLHLSTTTDYDTPELSPTGDRVVASYDTLTPTAETLGITVVGRGGGARIDLTARDLATTNEFDIEPTFSPDGTTVLFTRVTDTTPTAAAATYSYALWTVPANGSAAATALPGGGNGFGGAYKPGDATTIVFSDVVNRDTGAGNLKVLSGGTATSLGVQGNYPKYSPDGATIAYTTTVSASEDRLATVPATGGTATVFPAAMAGGSFAGVTSWLPDGESILFDLSTANGFELWAVDSRGTRAGVVVPSTATTEASGGYVNGPAPSAVVADTAPSTFVPVKPTRLLDTRTTNGGHLGKVGPGQSATLQVTGRTLNGGGSIPPGATAVILNVTVVNGTAPTVVRVFPAPAMPLPTVSNLNTIRAGQVLANQVTVKLPTGGPELGKVVLFNGAGDVDLVADVTGYYVPGVGNQRFAPLDPRRILDTRNGTGAPAVAVGPGGVIDLDVIGTLPVSGGGTVVVPADATAVVLNLTGTSPTTTTNIKAYPTPASGNGVPLVSSLNLVAGETAPNLVTVTVGSGGKVRLSNAAGSVQLLADLAGYYSPTATGGFVPVVPLRFLDTRSGIGAAPIRTTAGGFVDLRVPGARGVPASSTGVVLNLTGTTTTTPTVVRAYPATSSTPTVSNLNLVAGDSRANAVVVKPGTNGRVRILNGAGTLALVADLAGYFLPV